MALQVQWLGGRKTMVEGLKTDFPTPDTRATCSVIGT